MMRYWKIFKRRACKACFIQSSEFPFVTDSGDITVAKLTSLVERNEVGKSNLLLALHSMNPPALDTLPGGRVLLCGIYGLLLLVGLHRMHSRHVYRQYKFAQDLADKHKAIPESKPQTIHWYWNKSKCKRCSLKACWSSLGRQGLTDPRVARKVGLLLSSKGTPLTRGDSGARLYASELMEKKQAKPRESAMRRLFRVQEIQRAYRAVRERVAAAWDVSTHQEVPAHGGVER